MDVKRRAIIAAFTWLYLITTGICQDLPCRERNVGEGRSIVCVCDAEYCDTITREEPAPGSYVVYTTTNAGQRFEKSYGVIHTISDSDETRDEFIENEYEDADDDGDEENNDDLTYNARNSRSITIRLFPETQYQTIEGFGGSVTDAAAINWRKLSDAAQTNLINAYFSETGLEYNLIRVPIGGCDFSEHAYTYNEYPWNDAALSNFSLSEEDYFYKLPMIKRSQFVATDEIKLTASTWSPPIWMKTNERITGFGQLKREYYQAYADYHIRFIEEYEKAEVKIWAITTTNEPINGIIPLVNFNSLGWTPSELGRWVAHNLGPTIRNSKYNDTLILAIDDQRYLLPIWLQGMANAAPTSMDYIDGIAIHYYGNFVPPGILSSIQRRIPNKILLSTEACEGPMPWHLEKVILGSWVRGERYAQSILQDLNNFVVGWIDWNLCLDPQGGPNWAENFVDAPILVYGDEDEFIKQPMFYAMGHFSKFIPRGSVRIRAARRTIYSLPRLAVLTPQGNIVVVLQNRRDRDYIATIRLSDDRYIEVEVGPLSIKTIEININE